MVAFTQVAMCRELQYSTAQVQTLLTEEGEALNRLAPLDCSLQNIDQLRSGGTGAAGTAAGNHAQPADGRSAAAAGGNNGNGYARAASPGAGRAKPVQASYSQLMGMRVRELKRLLQEHGVDSSDCFEKEELVKRVLQRCTLAA